MRNPFSRNKHKTAQIIPNQDFLDGFDRFKKGERYEVEISKARYFWQAGWLEGSTAAPGDDQLSVDDSVIGQSGGF